MSKNNIKKDINTVKYYLIASFYNNPDIRYTIKLINKNTNVNKDTIKLVVSMLKHKRLITSTSNFKLTLDIVEMLENDYNNLQSRFLSTVSITLSCIALTITIFLNQKDLSFFMFLVILVTFIILFYYERKI